MTWHYITYHDMTCFYNIRPASSGLVDSYMLLMMSKSSGGHLMRLYVNLRRSSLTRQFSGFVPNTLKNHSKGLEFFPNRKTKGIDGNCFENIMGCFNNKSLLTVLLYSATAFHTQSRRLKCGEDCRLIRAASRKISTKSKQEGFVFSALRFARPKLWRMICSLWSK
jgi:hypothetical protein